MKENIQILIDFGSTFTKAVAVDLDKIEILARTRVPSTVDTDITIGLKQALKQLAIEAGIKDLDGSKAKACSSAAGGLRMVCVGFVPEYTSEAANLAALGAGARVVGIYSYELDEKEITEIESLAPDILLLSGGTDGGNTRVIIHNARLLARTGQKIPNIIVAGNKAAYQEIREIFKNSPKRIIFTANVMPEIGKLNLHQCNSEIRELFLKHIIEAKGISRAKALIGDVIMPTPSAVFEAAKLIAEGTANQPGLGELLIVDTGGATTNVHSIAHGNPGQPGVVLTGLPEPYAKRTVEGDLGLKYNLDTLLELMNGRYKSAHLLEIIGRFKEGRLPETEDELTCHNILSYLAVEKAVERHCGKLEEIYSPAGKMLLQRGKDLSNIGYVIGTGGALAYSRTPQKILSAALYNPAQPDILKPIKPRFLVDEQYILYAVGLLSQSDSEKAFKLAKRYLKEIHNNLQAN